MNLSSKYWQITLTFWLLITMGSKHPHQDMHPYSIWARTLFPNTSTHLQLPLFTTLLFHSLKLSLTFKNAQKTSKRLVSSQQFPINLGKINLLNQKLKNISIFFLKLFIIVWFFFNLSIFDWACLEEENQVDSGLSGSHSVSHSPLPKNVNRSYHKKVKTKLKERKPHMGRRLWETKLYDNYCTKTTIAKNTWSITQNKSSHESPTTKQEHSILP